MHAQFGEVLAHQVCAMTSTFNPVFNDNLHGILPRGEILSNMRPIVVAFDYAIRCGIVIGSNMAKKIILYHVESVHFRRSRKSVAYAQWCCSRKSVQSALTCLRTYAIDDNLCCFLQSDRVSFTLSVGRYGCVE